MPKKPAVKKESRIARARAFARRARKSTTAMAATVWFAMLANIGEIQMALPQLRETLGDRWYLAASALIWAVIIYRNGRDKNKTPPEAEQVE